MNRKEKRQQAKPTTAELKARERNKKTLEQALKFIDKSLADPEWYEITCNRICLIRCLGCMFDSLLYDVNDFIGFADIDTATRKSLSKINRQLDGLLDHILHDSVRRFGKRNTAKGLPEASEYEDVSKMSAGLQSLCELYLMWFVDTEWRQNELDKFMRRVIPDDVIKDRNKKTLEELHNSYDKTREKIINALNV